MLLTYQAPALSFNVNQIQNWIVIKKDLKVLNKKHSQNKKIQSQFNPWTFEFKKMRWDKAPKEEATTTQNV